MWNVRVQIHAQPKPQFSEGHFFFFFFDEKSGQSVLFDDDDDG